LEWAKLGKSEGQLSDALNVARIRGEDLDPSYLRKWAKELGVEDSLEKIIKEIYD
jgi:hypothetical protein